MKKSLSLLLFSLVLLPWPVTSMASYQLDRRYALESIGFIRTWDNVDGLFAEAVAQAYRSYLSDHSRFRLQDLTKADELMESAEIDYRKVIEDQTVLSTIARKFRVESLLRTKVYKEGPQYRFVLDWLHSPKMETLATHTFVFQGASQDSLIGGHEIRQTVLSGLEELLSKLPFKGHVTGRDGEWVTANLGKDSGVQPGDTLIIESLEEVRSHPLLNALVDWKMAPAGRARVDRVENHLVFAQVIEEEQGRQISRYQKVTKVLPKPADSSFPEQGLARSKFPGEEEFKPTLGFIAAGLLLGGYSRTYSSSGTSTPGKGTDFGASASGQLWLTQKVFADMDLMAGPTSLNVGAGGGNFFRTDLGVGYSFYWRGSAYGPRSWVKLGYHSTSYNLSLSAPEVSSTKASSLYLGLGGDFPVRGNVGVNLNFDLGLFKSGSESGASLGSVNSVNDFRFYFGTYFRFTPRMTLRAGFDVMVHDLDFSGGQTVKNRLFNFSPRLLYYF